MPRHSQSMSNRKKTYISSFCSRLTLTCLKLKVKLNSGDFHATPYPEAQSTVVLVNGILKTTTENASRSCSIMEKLARHLENTRS